MYRYVLIIIQNLYYLIVAILDKLPDTIAVTKVVTDFEAAIWKGVRETLFQVRYKDVFFTGDKQYGGMCTTWFPGMYIIHFYVIYRNRGRFDLLQIFQVAYNEKGSTYNYVRKLMALPFLPEEQIIPVFDTLKEQATTHMQPLVQYVEDTWILSTVFKPSNW